MIFQLSAFLCSKWIMTEFHASSSFLGRFSLPPAAGSFYPANPAMLVDLPLERVLRIKRSPYFSDAESILTRDLAILQDSVLGNLSFVLVAPFDDQGNKGLHLQGNE